MLTIRAAGGQPDCDIPLPPSWEWGGGAGCTGGARVQLLSEGG
jgi:hypothetical protein